MVPNLGAVIKNSAVSLFNNLFQGSIFKFSSFNQAINFIYICLMVFSMMKFKVFSLI